MSAAALAECRRLLGDECKREREAAAWRRLTAEDRAMLCRIAKVPPAEQWDAMSDAHRAAVQCAAFRAAQWVKDLQARGFR